VSGGARPKAKGSAFERKLCDMLSLWISRGQHDDLLWRSAMSGGRGTRREAKRGAQRVSGDICAVAPGGHVLTDYYHIEAKHVRRMEFTALALRGSGWLAKEWWRCLRQARSHNKLPMMIVRENRMPDIVLLSGAIDRPLLPLIVAKPELGCAVFLLSDLTDLAYVIPRARMP
jgi:hypothetical protein